jgi:hypothetical protein
MSAATPDPTGIEIPSDRTYLSHREVSELADDVKGIEETLGNPTAKIEDRQAVIKQLLRVKGDLEGLQPPDTTPEQRTELAKEERELREAWTVGMPSQAEMRKSPAGALGKHMAWEKLNKARIRRWKNVMRVLHKGDDDPDLSNIERFRGTNSTLGLETAQIPGKSIFLSPDTPQYKEGYDKIDWGDGAPADKFQALLEKIEALEARLEPAATNPVAEIVKPAKVHPNLKPMTSRCGKRTDLKGEQGLDAHARRCGECLAMPPEERKPFSGTLNTSE